MTIIEKYYYARKDIDTVEHIDFVLDYVENKMIFEPQATKEEKVTAVNYLHKVRREILRKPY